tara:strand:+ start:1143 stop:1760 length:618 start_codon:yes stop_codon:yes gene_type:complete
MKIKVCGLSNAEQVKTCVQHGADYCGFILNYPKSHRFIQFEKAKELVSIEKKYTKYVGVLVNPKNEELEKFSKLNIDYFQIYGNYNEKSIYDIKLKFNKKIIVAIQVKNKKDILNYKQFEKVADIILWDSSGFEQSLDWNFDWIKSIKSNVTKMIAGNINIDKLEKIFNLADIVDVSGALETNKVKDISKIKKFINCLKKLNNEN